MSSIGLDPVEAADFADHVARTPGTPLDDPWFTGSTIASPLMGLATGAANLSFLAEEAATPVLRPFAETLDKQFGTSGAAWLDEQQRLSREQIVRQQEISPRVFGKAGDMVRGLVQYGTEATAGTVVGGLTGFAAGATTGNPWIAAAGAIAGAPAGAVAVTGLAEALPRYYKLLSEGVDPDTAKSLAGIEGLVAGGTALLPLHAKTGGYLRSFGHGAALMAEMNAFQRGATHEILDNAGYHDMAEQYKFLDAQAILTDAVMGGLFGVIGHAMHGAPPGEQNPTLADAPLVDSVARDREARGPGIPADPYTRDANQAAVEKSIDDLLQGNPVDVSKEIDPERAKFVADPHDEEFRVQAKQVADEIVGPLPADQLGGGEPPAAPAAPADESGIVSPIDRTATPEEKVNQMVALSKENAPAVDNFLTGIDRDFGTESKSNFKAPENILSKSQRPSILAEKPWFGVEHIRDAFRFKTVLNDLSTLPDILARAREQGWQMVKADTAKVLAPKAWGFRIAAFDMRMPNGQIVEYYLPVREMEAAKDYGHQIFEKWRNRDTEKLSPAELLEMQTDMATSRAHYEAAWQAYLERTGQDESAVRASLQRAEAAASGTAANDSIRASAENLRPELQLPEASREAAQPESSTIARPSSATEASGGRLSEAELTRASIAENVPGVEPSAEASAGTARVRAMNEVEANMRLESQWQRLMGNKPETAAPGITKEDAAKHLARLDAAPGDNPKARAILEDILKAPEVKPEGAATPLEREVRAALIDNPTMEIPTATGELVPAHEAIAAADQQITEAAKAPDMLDAAINCDRKAA